MKTKCVSSGQSKMKRSILAACCASLVLGGCGAADPVADHVGENQDAIDAFSIVGALVAAGKALKDKNNHDLEITDLNLRLKGIENQLKDLETAVSGVVFAEKQSEALGVIRDVDAQRQQTFAALDIIASFPWMWAGPLTAAEAAAGTLSQPSYYTFAGRTPSSPTRFDPRAAAPSFVEAVYGWIGVRAIAGLPLDDAARQRLAGYAQFLNGIAAQIRSSVVCNKTISARRNKTPSGAPGAWHCKTVVTCQDAINETTTTPFLQDRGGPCSGTGTWYDAAYSAAGARTYGPDQLDQIAASWVQ
jgi:hypothetical protein